MTYLESYFKYCSPTWIFYSRNTNNKINKSHDRAPRLVYHENISTFKELLEKGQQFTIYHDNIQTFCIELYNDYNNLSQTIFSDFLARNDVMYSLRSQANFVIL